jgi:hypothetical protein
MSIKDYEDIKAEVIPNPGGANVRVSYSRGCSLDYGAIKVDYNYSAEFPAEEVDDALDRMKLYIDNRVRNALKEKL